MYGVSIPSKPQTLREAPQTFGVRPHVACSFLCKKGLLSDHLNLLLDKGQILSITVLLADDASLLADGYSLLADDIELMAHNPSLLAITNLQVSKKKP